MTKQPIRSLIKRVVSAIDDEDTDSARRAIKLLLKHPEAAVLTGLTDGEIEIALALL